MNCPPKAIFCIALLLLATACEPQGSDDRRWITEIDDAGLADAASHGDDGGDDEVQPAQILFPADEFVILQGSPTRPEATVRAEGGEVIDGAAIGWESADSSIIELSSGGFALGVEIGATELIATHRDLEERWPARVVGEAVAQVEVVPATATISVGWQLPYMVNLRDQWGTPITDHRPLQFSTSDEALATIDGDGLLTAHAPGEVEIMVVVEGVEDRAELVILDIDVESIAISPSSPSPMERGSTRQLSVSAQTEDGQTLEDQGAQWTSDDDSVATVDATGLVTAQGVGETTITAAVGDLEATVAIEVYFNIHRIAAGAGFSCALAGVQLFCWGVNDRGQLGDGTFGDSAEAVLVDFSGTVEDLSLGQAHGCLVDDVGEIWCWGANDQGQLGQPAGGESAAPQPLGTGTAYRRVSAGAHHTCAITTTDQAHCWGANDQGQLGSAGGSTHQPRAVSGGHSFVAITAGGRHSCAIDGQSQAYCWGANDRGQLGGASSANQSSTPQWVDGGYSFSTISAGADHTCSTSTSGPPVCWGAGHRGQLGVGSTDDQDIPLTLALQPGEGLIAVGSGQIHSCGLVAGGSPRCWGAYDDGRLGTTDTADAVTPQPIDGSYLFTRLAMGSAHACGRTADHQVVCWGAFPASGATPEAVDF